MNWRGILEQKWAWGVAGLVVGIGIGILFAWVIVPVEWVNVAPSDLDEAHRVEYMRMLIDSYSVNEDVALAIERYQALGEQAGKALEAVAADPVDLDPTVIQNLRGLVEMYEEQPTVPAAETPGETGTGGGGLGATVSRLILPACGVTLLLGLALAAALFLRTRLGGKTEEEWVEEPETTEYSPFLEEVETHAEKPEVGREALGSFRTSYTRGNDEYDDSFSIESASADFLGECGVGIGDVIGVGEPKKVSAFEVWLFDKNDIQTVTKVIMSRYAFNSLDTRSRLAAKGDPVLAEDGAVIRLETASLQVEARIVDISYGEGPLPAQSFFERLTIELTAYPRTTAPRAV